MQNNLKDLKKFWKNKKVFLTGHTGFKGTWFSILLKLLGAKVLGYSLKPSQQPNFYDLVNLNNLITKIKAQNKLNNQQIMDLLTNIYIKRYIQHMNQINAVSYKSYITYN